MLVCFCMRVRVQYSLMLFLFHIQNSELYGSSEELEALIKQAAHDRLRLEKEINRLKVISL